MPARDTYHDHVITAMVKDGWTITDDPLHLQYGEKDLYVDLGAEKLIGAVKGEKKIAVEVKSFLGPSDLFDLEVALGQFVLYAAVLRELQPDRPLFLAVRRETWKEVFEDEVGKLLIATQGLKIIVFDEKKKEILRWITS